jgi:hypothetical protein
VVVNTTAAPPSARTNCTVTAAHQSQVGALKCVWSDAFNIRVRVAWGGVEGGTGWAAYSDEKVANRTVRVGHGVV